MIQMSEESKDALGEVFNIAMGRAAQALSRLISTEVELSAPDVEILELTEIQSIIAQQGGDPSICVVREKFGGDLSGNALLIFPTKGSLELVRMILSSLWDDNKAEALSETQQEALVEVGNIILNACMGSIANLTQQDFETEIPDFLQGAVTTILDRLHDNSQGDVLFVRVQFGVSAHSINGFVGFLMDIDTLETFQTRIEKSLLAPLR